MKLQKEGIYIPHFIGARNDRKIKRLRKDMGPAGYAYFFMTLEILREQTDYKYPIEDIDLLADEIGASLPMTETMIRAYDLFVIDESNFYSPKLIEYIQPFLKTKEQRVLAGRASAKKRKEKHELLLSQVGSSQRPLNENDTTVQQTKLKQTKLKQTKLKQTKLKKTTNLVSKVMKFKKDFIKNYMFDGFYLDKMKDETLNHKYYTLNEIALICETQTKQTVSREQAIEIWQFLYFENLKKGEEKNQIAS